MLKKRTSSDHHIPGYGHGHSYGEGHEGSRASRPHHPLPSAISAGCGLCFMAPLEAREVLEQEMKRQDITWELITELML